MEGQQNGGHPSSTSPVHISYAHAATAPSWLPASSAQRTRHSTHVDTSATGPPLTPAQPTPQLAELDYLLPQLPAKAAAYQQQLANYNKLVQSGNHQGPRGRVSSPLLPQYPATSHPAPTPTSAPALTPARKASGGHDGASKLRSNTRGHGSGHKKAANRVASDSAVMTSTDAASVETAVSVHSKPVVAKPSIQKQLPTRTFVAADPDGAYETTSVPSTPHQYAHKCSLDSREPSPDALPGHSPRSAYSETDTVLSGSRHLPPQLSGCRFETAQQRIRRRIPYKIGDETLEKMADEKIISKLSEADERTLATDMRELYDRLLPAPESQANRAAFVQKLETLLNDKWPGHDIRVNMFGSSGNMLYTDESDVDICISTSWKDLEDVCKLAELLAASGMEQVVCVSTAKVPIVKVWDPVLKLACDMNVNNTLALENTRMIKTYVEIDDRVRPLAMIIKHWTKRRIINDAALGGTLTSYTWICMILNFLQTRKPPVLPCLHNRGQQQSAKAEDGSSAFSDDIESMKDFGSRNKENIAELLFHFFRFYAYEMDYDADVVSVRAGSLIPKKDKSLQFRNNKLCVEEPFNIGRNLGNTADDFSFRGLHLELRRAFDLVAEAKLEEMCEEFVFPKEEERTFQRPVPRPRPIITRTPSMANRARGNYRNNAGRSTRHLNRRTSVGAYDSMSPHVMPIHPQQALLPDWRQQMHNDLHNQLSSLKAQENSLRQMLMSQSQHYAHMASMAAYHHNRHAGGLVAHDRIGDSSLDHTPMTAPLRQEIFYGTIPNPTTYNQNIPGHMLSSQHAANERRSGQRLPGANEVGGLDTSGSILRSHSQPGSRTMPYPNFNGGALPVAYGLHGQAAYQLQYPTANPQIPNSFTADDLPDPRHSVPASPSFANEHYKEYVGYYVDPARYTTNTQHGIQTPTGVRRDFTVAPIPPYQGRARQNGSLNGMPPSGVENGTTHASFAQTHDPDAQTSMATPLDDMNASRARNSPPVVNGSTPIMDSLAARHSIISAAGNSMYGDDGNEIFLSQASPVVEFWPARSAGSQGNQILGLHNVWPNTTYAQDSDFDLGIIDAPVAAPVHSQPVLSMDYTNSAPTSTPDSRADTVDDANRKQNDVGSEISHLSPVYEARSPPAINHKLESNMGARMHTDRVSEGWTQPPKTSDATELTAANTINFTNSSEIADGSRKGITAQSESSKGTTGVEQTISNGTRSSTPASTPVWQKTKSKKKQTRQEGVANGQAVGLTTAEATNAGMSERRGG